MPRSELFAYDGDKAIRDDGTIDLYLDGVHGGPPERFYLQVLFHPLEEQSDLPAFLVQQSYLQGVQIGVVGQKDEFPTGLRVAVLDLPRLFGTPLFRIVAFQSSYLVVPDAFHPVRRRGVHPFEAHVRLGAGDEKGLLQMDGVEPGEVDVRLIHHVKAAGLVGQQVEHVDIVEAGLGDMEEARHGRFYVVVRMELYASLGLLELGPPKHAQAKVYGAEIKGVHVALDIDFEIVAITAPFRLTYQYAGELLEDLMAPFLVWRSRGCAARPWFRSPDGSISCDGPPGPASGRACSA